MVKRNRAIKLWCAALAIGLCWWVLEGQPAPLAWAAAGFKRVTQTPQTPQVALQEAAAGLDAAGRASSPSVNPDVVAPNIAPATSPSRFAGQEASLGLMRQLSGDQKITYGQRDRTVLGTKEVGTPPDTPQTVLLVRDEESGQIDYWQSGLRIELKPGNDYAAFIAERAGLTRRFANSTHADVGVDAADIAKVHAELLADSRVLRVQFLPVSVPPKAQ